MADGEHAAETASTALDLTANQPESESEPESAPPNTKATSHVKQIITQEEALKKGDDAAVPSATDVFEGLKAIDRMRFFNDILAVLAIVFVVLLIVYVMPDKIAGKLGPVLKKLNTPGQGLPLLSFLLIIAIVIFALRQTSQHIQERLGDPCDAWPPVRVDPSNRVYAAASFVYMYLVGYIRIILSAGLVLLGLFLVFLTLNSNDQHREEITFRHEDGLWRGHMSRNIVLIVLIIPAVLIMYQYLMRWIINPLVNQVYGLSVKSFENVYTDPDAHTYSSTLTEFFKPSNLLTSSQFISQTNHIAVFIVGVVFSIAFGLLFINTAQKEAVCAGKKDEKKRYTVFKNRSTFGFLVVMAIVIFMYLGLWGREFMGRMTA